jgi:hypothetical protein
MTSRVRLGAAALAVAGILFLLYPAFRPWHDETTLAGATASLGSGAWVASHLFAMLGFILLPFGLLALQTVAPGKPASAGLVVGWIGAGLVLPYYGAEDFGLHAAAARGVPDLLGFAEAVRYQPVAMTIFGAGLVMLGVGAILAAVAAWRAGISRLGAVLFGAGFALFLPQFFTPAAVRIGHGVLVAAGCVLLAAALYRTRRPT